MKKVFWIMPVFGQQVPDYTDETIKSDPRTHAEAKQLSCNKIIQFLANTPCFTADPFLPSIGISVMMLVLIMQ